MSGSPGGLRAVPSVAAASSSGTASCPREASRGGGQRHPRIPFCSSGLQAGCGPTSRCSTRHTDIQQQASAAQRVRGPARHLGALAVTLPTGCLQPVGLAPALVARGPACCSATSKKRTFKVCGNRTFKVCANTVLPSVGPCDLTQNCITGAVGSMISKRAECTFSQGPEYGTHAAVHVFRCSLPALGIQVEAPGGTVST